MVAEFKGFEVGCSADFRLRVHLRNSFVKRVERFSITILDQ
jgi:hypothetical protein